VAVRSKALAYRLSLAMIVGSNPGGSVDVSFDCHFLSGRGLCEGLITSPDESYRVWCDRETSQRKPRRTRAVEP